MRFHILYDAETRLYWLLGSQSTDSMCRPETLPPERYSLPNNERHRLQLHFSKNCIDWCFAGLVAVGPSPHHARHYASMAIQDRDLHILSRSGDEEALNPHDGNLITFHTIKTLGGSSIRYLFSLPPRQYQDNSPTFSPRSPLQGSMSRRRQRLLPSPNSVCDAT